MTMTGRRFGEGTTGDGQMVRFWTPDEDVGDTKEVLKKHFSSIELPVTYKTNVEHGGYGRYSRFDIKKVVYWASNTGYYEILSIADAPDGHHPYVSHSYQADREHPHSFFIEWESIEAAQHSLEEIGAPRDIQAYTHSKEKIPGMIRAVETNLLSPWFYAAGEAQITGDYVFPERLANDPVYQPGRRFLVPVRKIWRNEVEHRALKISMGAITQEVSPSTPNRIRAGDFNKPYFSKILQWADGSVTRIDSDTPHSLMPTAVDSEPWLTTAVDKVQLMLSGMALSFTVDFVDGGKFIGRFVEPKEVQSDVEGDYLLNVSFADGSTQEGWFTDFKPNEDAPNVTLKVVQVFSRRGMEVSHVEILDKKTRPGGKKWKGVYYNRLAKAVSDEQTSANSEL